MSVWVPIPSSILTTHSLLLLSLSWTILLLLLLPTHQNANCLRVLLFLLAPSSRELRKGYHILWNITNISSVLWLATAARKASTGTSKFHNADTSTQKPWSRNATPVLLAIGQRLPAHWACWFERSVPYYYRYYYNHPKNNDSRIINFSIVTAQNYQSVDPDCIVNTICTTTRKIEAFLSICQFYIALPRIESSNPYCRTITIGTTIHINKYYHLHSYNYVRAIHLSIPTAESH